MTSPKLSSQIPDPNDPNNTDGIGRMYAREPGGVPQVPSITTVMSMMNPNMDWWRGYCAGKEAVRLASLIHERTQKTPSQEWRSKEREIVTWISEASVRDMKYASQRGDLVHDYAEKVCRNMLGESYDLDAERTTATDQLQKVLRAANLPVQGAPGYFDSVHRFLEDFQVRPVAAEGTVWNETEGYAGTNDLLCYIDGRLTLLDWKTKKKIKTPGEKWYSPSIKTSISLQLEAAQHGEEMYDESTDQWVPWKGRDAVEHVGVALGPNGYEAMRVRRDPDTWEAFKGLRRAWDWWIADHINAPHLGDLPMRPQNPWG